MALRDAGLEVVYLGLRQSARQIVAAAVAEDADAIGVSVLSGVHVAVSRDLRLAQQEAGIEDVPLIVGGTVPPTDVPVLREIGVSEVFGVGTPVEQVVAGVREVVTRVPVRESAGGATARTKPGGPAPEAGEAARGHGNREEARMAEPVVSTESGIPVEPLYEPGAGPDSTLGRPGEPPFTRGPYRSMYRERLWTMRQYAGFGSAEDTNARYRYLLGQGQTALSVAFDLPTQLGYDSTHELAAGEVGRVGVAVDTADDMAAVFDGLPLDEVSVNFTINATAPIMLAFYIVAAERRGVPPSALAGTLQNDILKEFLARKLHIFPPAASLRLAGDVVEFCARDLPRFNPISVTGYHAREAGCDAVQELGLMLAAAIVYCEHFTARGLDFDSFAPRLSFHLASQLDFFEEVAKVRAARRAWYRIATERFGARRPESGRLRFFSGCSGATLTAREPLNNVVRSTLQCMSAVLGGAQSVHVMGYDEALEIPTEESVRLALRTQQIIAYESGVTRTVDPLAGSYYVESLTDQVEQRALDLVRRIDAEGGYLSLLEQGIPQRWIAESAYRAERAVGTGEQVKVGVNRFTSDGDEQQPALFTVDTDAGDRQRVRLARRLAARETAACDAALRAVAGTWTAGGNTMPALIDAARAGCTVGEITDVLRGVAGEYREPQPW
jgi:methylmalonyl-CoA mutase N-terminal domain/subunit